MVGDEAIERIKLNIFFVAIFVNMIHLVNAHHDLFAIPLNVNS